MNYNVLSRMLNVTIADLASVMHRWCLLVAVVPVLFTPLKGRVVKWLHFAIEV